MCGRFVRTNEPQAFTGLVAGLTFSDAPLSPRFNISPSQQALVARETVDGRTITQLRWGFIPHWAKDTKIGYKMINARSETAATKPAFRDSFKCRRCLVAADGWYEWRVTASGKTPMYIRRLTRDGEIAPFFFAGLWATWHDKATPDATPLETFTILTRDAAPSLAGIHDRRPVVLPVEAYAAWLDPKLTEAVAVEEFVSSAVLDSFHAYPVSTRVNTPKNDDAACIAVA